MDAVCGAKQSEACDSDSSEVSLNFIASSDIASLFFLESVGISILILVGFRWCNIRQMWLTMVAS